MTPKSLSLRSGFRRWHFAAEAFLRRVYSSILAVRSSRRVRSLRVIDVAAIIALAAVRTWHTVSSAISSGFFPPEFLPRAGEKQQRHGSNRQMPLERFEAADLEVVHAQFRLLVFKTSLDSPAAEAHLQQHLQRRPGRGIGDEVFHLRRIRHVTGDDQPMGAGGHRVPLELKD